MLSMIIQELEYMLKKEINYIDYIKSKNYLMKKICLMKMKIN